VEPDEVERNRALLEEKVEEILNNLNKKVNQMPIGIRYIVKIVREQTLKSLGPEQENIMMGSFLFLRYINPAIFSPEKVESLIPKGKQPSDISRRNLTLITKVLQNLSNEKNTTSSRKESFMEGLQAFLLRKKPMLVEYYKKVLNFQFNPSVVHDTSIYDATDADYQLFHALIEEPDISTLFKDKTHLEEFNFLLDKLGPYVHKKLFTELEDNDQKLVREYLEHCIDSEIVCATSVEVSLVRNNTTRRKAVLVIGRNKIYLFKSKDKIFKEFHLLDLTRIESERPGDLILIFSTNNINDEENLTCYSQSDNVDHLITALRRAYAFIFHNNNFVIRVKPETGRLKHINLQLDDSPCSGLVQTYKSLCDYYEGTVVNPFVCYALENFYSRNKVLDIDRLFNNTEQPFTDKDAVPLFHALGFNSHFNSLVVRNMKFDKTTLDGLAKMLLINTSISSLTLSGVSLKDRHNPNVGYFTLFDAMSKNEKIALTSLDLSNTPLENKRDRESLADFIVRKFLNNFVKLDLSISKDEGSEGIPNILNALCQSKAFGNYLTELRLSGIKLDDVNNYQSPLCAFLKKSHCLEILSLARTRINLNYLIAKGLMNANCCSTLTKIDLSNQKILKNEDWESLYKWLESPSVCSLQFLDISNTSISTKNFKLLLKFQNENRKDGENLLSLKATKNSFKQDTALAISKIGTRIVSFDSLDLADNALGDDGIQSIAESLFHNTVIRKLNLNRNFRFQNPQQRNKMIQHLSEMIGSNFLKLESLSIAGINKNNKDSRLKESLATLLPCLSKNKYLLELDISGHHSGNPGSFALAQVLEINNTLTKLNWDDNNSTILGIQSITKSLKLNHSITQMPIPITDICRLIGLHTSSTDKELRREITVTVDSLQKILKRNQKY